MSLIFGIFNRNGKPINPEDINDMYQAVSYFPHEKYDIKLQENIAFGHMLTYNTPESIYEQMPKYLPEQNIMFMFQGRLSNRDEISNKLDIRLTDKLTDGELILKSYIKWGKESPDKLIGQWSFAVFDFKTQELFLAQDHHSYTSMFYYLTDDLIIFSSSIKSLLALKQIPKELNRKSLTGAIVISFSKEKDHTLYKDIFHLLPAHTLLVNTDHYEKKRYWFPENIETVYKKNKNEYAIELKEILNNSVRESLRSYKPVSSMLSGGLDSGAVSWLAADLMKDRGEVLTTYSHVPFYQTSEDKNRYGDETPYINATVNSSGNINPILIDCKDSFILEDIFKMIDIIDGLIYGAVNSNWLIDITSNSFKDGFSTLLTGENGNANISFSGVDYLLPLLKFYKSRGIKKTIKQRLIKPFLLKNFSDIYKKVKYSENYWETYSYINSEYAEKINLQNLFKENASLHKLSYQDSKENMLAILMPGFNPRCYSGAALSHYFGVEWLDPTADKRVTEYALAIPNEAFFDEDGENKNIMKMMMKNKLPDKVLYSKEKGQQGADIGIRLINEKNQIDELINQLSKSELICETIDIKKINNDWEQIKTITNNKYNIGKINHLLRTLMIAIFLKRFD